MTKMKSKTALPPTGLVARYEQAYNHVVDKLPAWKKTIIVNHEDTSPQWERISSEVAHEVVELAESEGWKPSTKNY